MNTPAKFAAKTRDNSYSDEGDYGEGIRRTKSGVEGCAGSSTSFIQPDDLVNE